jgi:hypothetical protein
MKKEGGQEAGYCSKMVSDRGDRCLFTFNVALICSSTINIFCFRSVKPSNKAIRGIGSHIQLAQRDIGAPIYWRTDVPLRQQAMLTRHGAAVRQ